MCSGQANSARNDRVMERVRRYVAGAPLAFLNRVRIVVCYKIQDNVVLKERL